MRFDGSAFGLKRFRMMWAAVLALPIAVGFAAAGAALFPTFSHTGTIDAPPGVTVTVRVGDVFDNAGTNPVFQGVGGTTTYLDNGFQLSDDSRDRFTLTVKSAADLNAMASPPSSPFTFRAGVTMTNDEGETASGTITFETTYVQTSAVAALPSVPTPTLSQTETLNAPPGVLVFGSASRWFDNAGTNPRITEAVFSTTQYYKEHSVSIGLVFVQAKSVAELNALASPPPSSFTVDVTVTMTNDEGQEASGTITFQTEYPRAPASAPSPPPPPPPSEPEEPEDAGPPTFSLTRAMTMGPSAGAGIHAHEVFDNVGTNARITEAVFSTRDYLGGNYNKVAHGQLWLRIKSTAELNAMAAPPPSPFRFNVDVTMANDEGETASGTITFQVRYERAATTTSSQASEPAATGPTFSQTETIDAPPGTHVPNRASRLFDNAGTNPRITEAVYSTQDYYHWGGTGIFRDGTVNVQVKTAAELNAMAAPPPSPFTVTVDVTMTNDEGETASGTLTFRTTYERTAAAPLPEAATGPTLSQTGTLNAPPGMLVSGSADGWFRNAGTNPRFTDTVFSTTEYYRVHDITNGRVWVQAKSAAELNALATPPPSPFTVTVDLTMTNDEGETATGTVTYRTTYERTAGAPLPEAATEPTFSHTGTIDVPPGTLVSRSADGWFRNAGTNPRFTDTVFSTTEYYRVHEISNANGRVWVQAKSAAELNALASPPPSPFTVTVDLTMTNDEGQTATGTVTYRTTYDRIPTTPSQPNEPGVSPTFVDRGLLEAPAGELINVWADTPWFRNAGANPRIIDGVLSTTEYYSVYEIRDDMVFLQAKTSAELNALESPPPSPFRVSLTVTMANDRDQRASGTITFYTAYHRVSVPASSQPVPASSQPPSRPPTAGGSSDPPE